MVERSRLLHLKAYMILYFMTPYDQCILFPLGSFWSLVSRHLVSKLGQTHVNFSRTLYTIERSSLLHLEAYRIF